MIGYAYLEDLGEGIGDPSAHEEFDFFPSSSFGGRKSVVGKASSEKRGGKNRLTSANALQPRRRPRPIPGKYKDDQPCAREIHGYNIVQADATYFPLDEASRDVYVHAATAGAARKHRTDDRSSRKPRMTVGDVQVSRYRCMPGGVRGTEDDDDDVMDDDDDEAVGAGAAAETERLERERLETERLERERLEEELVVERRESIREKEEERPSLDSSQSRAMLQEMVATTWQDLLLYALSGLLLIFFLEQVFQMGLNAPRGTV